jgi:hypothetical protein
VSLDLYENEVREREVAAPKTAVPETSAWDGFLRGTGMSAMQTFAKAGRAGSLAVSAIPVALDAMGDDTQLQEKYFRWHDETMGAAVDHWTPKPDEVGVAGQITGQLLATLPMVVAAPGAAVAATGLGTAEDLVRKGVEPVKAIAAGEIQALGLGLGIYVPILGRTLAQRVLVGGAGFNLFQGAVTRAGSEAVLQGTPGADDFKALDPTAMTLDVLLGAAFGGIAHVSPSARAQGAKAWEHLDAWGKNLKPSDVDALLVMRQAQHINADSLPGIPKGPEDVGAHVARVKQAIDQLATDQRVEVENLPKGQWDDDPHRVRTAQEQSAEMVRIAEDVRSAEGLPEIKETEAPPAPRGAEPPPPRSDEGRPGGAEAKGEPPDPVVLEAKRVADEAGDMEITVGRDSDGKPQKMKVKDFLAASDEAVKLADGDAKLFEVAAACMLGGA